MRQGQRGARYSSDIYRAVCVKKKIVIVDDSGLTHSIYKVFLAKYRDIDVISCFNGAEALEAINDSAGTNLVLLDIEMPVMDGFQFLEKKNANNRLKDIPVVVMSWKDNQENVRKVMDMGVLGFISKSEIEKINDYIKKSVWLRLDKWIM
jgi:PleD family two-component response regulator